MTSVFPPLSPSIMGSLARLAVRRLPLLFLFGGLVAARAGEPELRVLLAGQALIKHDLAQVLPAEIPAMAALVQADRPHVAFTDLETTIQGSFGGSPTRKSEFFHATQPAVLDVLKSVGFNLLATGNNHAWDLGPEGILSTLTEVDRRGFVRAGSGRNLGEAAAPAFLETAAGRVALVAFASGRIQAGGAAAAMRPGSHEVRVDAEKRVVVEDLERVLSAIRLAARHAAVVIVYQHDHYWEDDKFRTPAWKREFARACLDAGGTVFVSHGIPQLHGLDFHGGKPIFYSLGSFVFHTVTKVGYYTPETWQSVLADLRFQDGRLTFLRLRPVLLNEKGSDASRFNETRGVPRLAAGADARRVLEHFVAQSREYATRIRIEGDVGIVDFGLSTKP